MADIKAIAEELVNLTVKEVNELATVLKDEYGIEPAAAAVAVAAGPAAGGAVFHVCCRHRRTIRHPRIGYEVCWQCCYQKIERHFFCLAIALNRQTQ